MKLSLKLDNRFNFFKLKKLFNVITIICFISLMTACAFTSHNSYVVPAELNKLTLKTNQPYSNFTRNLNTAFTFAHVSLLPKGQAPFILYVSTQGIKYNTPLVVTSSQARVYRISYTLTFQLTDAKGNLIGTEKSVTTTRDLILVPNQLLGTNNQLDNLVNEMQNEAIYRIFSQLNSPTTKSAITAYLTAQYKNKHKH